MNKRILTFHYFLVIWLTSVFWVCSSQANEIKTSATLGEYTVYYNVFNSLFIQPKIANIHKLPRAKNRSLINISVKKTSEDGTIPVTISGYARNLMQQQTKLNFREIIEKDAVYYIADLRSINREIFHFDIEFQAKGGSKQQLKFTRKLFIEK